MPQKGEKLKLKIWRDNKELDVAVPMEVRDDDINIGNLYDTPPRYFVSPDWSLRRLRSIM